MAKIDLRKLPCPEPVLRVKDLLDATAEGVLTVVVDNGAAMENVSRFARSQGFTVEARAVGEDFEITIAKGFDCRLPEPAQEAATAQKRAFLFLSDTIGENRELGAILTKAFFSALPRATVLPARIIFLNSSVKLASEGSEVLEDLAVLQKDGVEILSCGTCLDFFGLKEKLKAGRITNMYDTVETLTSGFSVTTIS